MQGMSVQSPWQWGRRKGKGRKRKRNKERKRESEGGWEREASESATEETGGRSSKEGKDWNWEGRDPKEDGREEEGEAELRPAGSRSIESEGVKRRNNGQLSCSILPTVTFSRHLSNTSHILSHVSLTSAELSEALE